jgi:hypothetical protein
MANRIKIGHARHSEGITKADGTKDWRDGYAGDQHNDNPKKAEVLVVDNYKINNVYHTILRPISTALALKSAKACEDACNNPNVGYSQYSTYDRNRNSLHTEAKKVNFDLAAITTPCNTDCSAFMTLCAVAGGATFSYGLDNKSNAPTCSSMKRWFTSKGEYQVLTDPIYFNSTDYLKRGDILIKKGHTIMVLGYGEKVPLAEQYEDYAAASNFSALSIKASITNIKATKATIKAKITKVENNTEITVPKDILDNYSWTYELTPLTSVSSVSHVESILDITDSFSLKNLESSSSYLVRIVAKEKNGNVTINSPDILLTTAAKQAASNAPAVEFKEIFNNLPVCTIFLKIADTFKHAILYNRHERR